MFYTEHRLGTGGYANNEEVCFTVAIQTLTEAILKRNCNGLMEWPDDHAMDPNVPFESARVACGPSAELAEKSAAGSEMSSIPHTLSLLQRSSETNFRMRFIQ
jgi:hypothetical protein